VTWWVAPVLGYHRGSLMVEGALRIDGVESWSKE